MLHSHPGMVVAGREVETEEGGKEVIAPDTRFF